MTLLWSSTLQSAGLISDILGALLLFFFGLPRIGRTGGANFLELASTNETALKKEAKYDRNGGGGVILLIIGFALQLSPNLCVAIAEWIRP